MKKSLSELSEGLNIAANMALHKATGGAKEHPFGKIGRSVVLPDGKLYKPSPATIHYATSALLPFIVDWFVRYGRTPSHVDISHGLGIKSIDRVRKLLHVLMGLGYIGKNADSGVTYLIGATDQVLAGDILKGVTKEFLESLSVLPIKYRTTILSLVKFTAKSKWVLKE